MTDGAQGFEPVLAAALPYLQTRHNDVHTRISREFAERLLAEEGGNPQVVIPAILLHDIGWSRVPEDRQLAAFGPNVQDPELTKVHEREGAGMAGEILAGLGWPQALADEIVDIIAGHDTRPGSASLHESIVKDADKLFRLSDRGFPIDCERFAQNPPNYLDWLEDQLDRWFFTETARRLAREEIAARRTGL
ncbi:MAG: HD domain-containing protein [Deferrisomatales bacterium]|nr:HD domain-containing protein [Deferrisomatales bacterium]